MYANQYDTGLHINKFLKITFIAYNSNKINEKINTCVNIKFWKEKANNFCFLLILTRGVNFFVVMALTNRNSRKVQGWNYNPITAILGLFFLFFFSNLGR